MAVWTFRARGRDAASAAAMWPAAHLLIAVTGHLASPLIALGAAWAALFARRAPRWGMHGAGAALLLGLGADWMDGTAPGWAAAARWALLMGVGPALAGIGSRMGRGASTGNDRPQPAPAAPREGAATDSETVDTAIGIVLRATDAHEAALWRAEGEQEDRSASLMARVAAPDVPAPASPVALAGHPFAWAIDERLPQRIERGKRDLPSPWAAEMLLVPVETEQGGMVLSLAYPGMVPPGAEAAAVRGGQHLATVLGLLRGRSSIHRAEAGMRAMADAVRVLPGELEMGKFAGELCAVVRQGTGAAGAAVMMVTDDSGRGKVLHASGDPMPMAAEAFGEGESRVALAVKHGVDLAYADLKRERDRLPLLAPGEKWERAPRSAVVLPLMVDGRAIGAVAAWHPEPGRFGEREREILHSLCSIAPLPMRSARRFEALDHRASTDPLTDLPNRSAFDQRLTALSGYFDRYARPFSLIAIDVDFFKKFNDTWGHEAGDRVLRHVADLLKATVRDVDLPARLGGEEFVVLLPETTLRQATEAAERIRRSLESRSVNWNGRPLSVTASLGVACVPDCTAVPADALALADAALYRAKELGRNRVAAAPRAEKEAGTRG
ncbi:sensor domain-containing diguanylate cyclase [Longimicrobium terrae]|uniref:diguanylate cyclase n=1 Tax=Longimicrobium terrae TaxID=1639882 RepID=A0A841H3Y0_9BACT|nr:sensor domain-containing diguanylate cyclase [Longimicrobium terrae]MBB4638447.1 diguanylate cyclase (GGDEF)-like protein [Longimicrobium terrae]MBB6072710.1 diguanylate cyclase (GGDEF)-like protein [Longimicrobium terrae]